MCTHRSEVHTTQFRACSRKDHHDCANHVCYRSNDLENDVKALKRDEDGWINVEKQRQTRAT